MLQTPPNIRHVTLTSHIKNRIASPRHIDPVSFESLPTARLIFVKNLTHVVTYLPEEARQQDHFSRQNQFLLAITMHAAAKHLSLAKGLRERIIDVNPRLRNERSNPLTDSRRNNNPCLLFASTSAAVTPARQRHRSRDKSRSIPFDIVQLHSSRARGKRNLCGTHVSHGFAYK